MPFLFKGLKSSSASSSPSNSIEKVEIHQYCSSSPKRRLTRQRKLRNVSDDQLCLGRPVKSLPVSPEYSHIRSENHWSKSAVPQPLPLPHVNLQTNHRNIGTEIWSKAGEVISKVNGDVSYSMNSSNSTELTHVKAVDHTTTRCPRTPTYARRGFFQGLNVEGVEPVFTLSVPPRSAPGSVFSSPMNSPPSFSTASHHLSPNHHSRHHLVANADRSPLHSPNRQLEGVEPVFKLSVPPRSSPGSEFSTPISSHCGFSTGSHYFSPNHHSSKIIASTNHSPLHSPSRQVGLEFWNHDGNHHLRDKPIRENYMQWHDSSIGDLHPLPLPPGVPSPIHSPNRYYCLDSPILSPKKSQWQRGKLIGRGTYGSVYVATHRETGALCAMKEVDLIPDDPKCVECIKQLEQEIKVLRQLRHPNIVQYYGSEIIEDRFCIYLEYVHPGSINNYVNEHCGAMTESIVRSFTRHILSGLAYLHKKKTIHRDIKGANLLVNASGVVKLADFGLAKHLTGSVINLSLKGSPHWMAPEVLQAVLRKNANPDQAWAVDIWSLGCTVIEMFTGKPPWSEFNGVQAMFSVINKNPPIPEMLSCEGKHFLKLCLQREPMNRPSAADLLDHPFLQN
ncbi:non-receptor serine/threonine protein kinase [Lithospermum erythrorhizon]|uniref:mitogen-activated protein kinase kinase kinase n=1 Tax=Lithospermum erythrorhizon TaxID=34254 RepID=A0AAV3QYF8_LITER